jgi:hypothetical protein
VRALDFNHIIGGHGDVQHDRQRLDQMAAYIEEMTNQVAEKKLHGLAREETQQQIGVESLRSVGEYGPFFARQLLAYDSTYFGRSEADIVAQAVREGVAATFDVLSRRP